SGPAGASSCRGAPAWAPSWALRYGDDGQREVRGGLGAPQPGLAPEQGHAAGAAEIAIADRALERHRAANFAQEAGALRDEPRHPGRHPHAPSAELVHLAAEGQPVQAAALV